VVSLTAKPISILRFCINIKSKFEEFLIPESALRTLLAAFQLYKDGVISMLHIFWPLLRNKKFALFFSPLGNWSNNSIDDISNRLFGLKPSLK